MAKRVLDIAVALPVILFILPPFMLLVWIMHRIYSPGPLFFRQIRAGASIGTIGTLALSASSVTLAAEVETNVPVTGSPILVPGDVIDVQMVQSGTGLASPAGVVAKAELV